MDEQETWCVDCGAFGYVGVCPGCIAFGEPDAPEPQSAHRDH